MNNEIIERIDSLRENIELLEQIEDLLTNYNIYDMNTEDFIEEIYEMLDNRIEADKELLQKFEKRGLNK